MREGIILMFDAQGTSAAWTRSDFAGRDGGFGGGVVLAALPWWQTANENAAGVHLERKWP